MPFAVKQQVTSSKIHLLVLSPQLKLKFCFSPISELWVDESTAGADGIDWNNGMRTIQVVLAHCSDGWSLLLFILQEFLCLFASQSCFSSVFLWTPHGHEVPWFWEQICIPDSSLSSSKGRKCGIAAISAGCFLHTPLLPLPFLPILIQPSVLIKNKREREILSQRKENHLGIKLFLQFREKTF